MPVFELQSGVYVVAFAGFVPGLAVVMALQVSVVEFGSAVVPAACALGYC